MQTRRSIFHLGLFIAVLCGTLLSAVGSAPVPVGIVEGFYGPTWSHEDRQDMVRFLGTHRLDLYIYAPKDDPLHRSDWRQLYGPAEMAQFRELARACMENRVNFCFAVSPGGDMTYSDPSEQRLLLDKMMSLHADGVTHFALFLDDIDIERMGEADRAQFATAAEAQMALANSLRRQMLEREPDAWFLICPTEYLGTEPSPYWDTLREQLDPDIAVAWTGPKVISPTITDEDLDKITAHFGRPPFIWDNYPVNDFWRGSLRLGPVVGRTPNLLDRISGYAANPMNEAHASMIALATISDALHQGADYDPERSWRHAIEEIGGDAAGDLLLFAEQSRASDLDSTESSALGELVDAHVRERSPESRERLEAEITRLHEVGQNLEESLDPALADELEHHAEILREKMNAMMVALEFMEGEVADDMNDFMLRYISGVRSSEVLIATEPSERLFDAAVGMSADYRRSRGATHRVDAVNPFADADYPGGRGPDQLIVYTPAYHSPTTGTNQWGAEVTARSGTLTEIGTRDSAIPANGFVVSGHGEAAEWIRDNLTVGVSMHFASPEIRFDPPPFDQMTLDQQLDALRFQALDLISERVASGAPHEACEEARSALREADAIAALSDAEAARVRASALHARIAALPTR